MKISKRQVFYFLLSLISAFVAWYSLGAIPSCAPFDIGGFCDELFSVSNNADLMVTSANCYRLADISANLCS